MKGTWRLSL